MAETKQASPDGLVNAEPTLARAAIGTPARTAVVALTVAGIALITANWFLVAFLVVSIVDLALRIPKEEQMMLDEFGDEYKAYMQRTGKLLPKW